MSNTKVIPEFKSPKESEVEMRHLVMPNHTNPRGTIFGGVIMSWIDLAAGMVAMKHAQMPAVTAHVDAIDFLLPAKVGQIIIVKSSLNYVGNSSMIIGVKVECEDPFKGTIQQTTRAYLTFVALDENGKKSQVPKLQLETEDEKRRYENAKAMVEARKKLNPLRKK